MTRTILLSAALLVAISAGGVRVTTAAATGTTSILALAGRTNATPSIAADGARVVVAWSATAGGATDIYVASSADGGRTFTSPVRVNDVAGNANVSGEQPPRVTFVARRGTTPAVVVVWTAKGGAGTRIMTARSEDAGRSFGAARTLSGGDAPGNRGWESAAANAGGDGVVMWLDHRELAMPAAAGKPMTHDHVAMSMPHDPASAGKEQLSKLYFQPLDGRRPATALTGGVCYCCKTSIVAGADRTFYAVWRHVYSGNVRDIAFTMSSDGGETFAAPIRVSEDRWAIDGCPENGPAVAVTGRDVVVVWPTLVTGAAGAEPAMRLFYAITRDGRSFTSRTPMPTEGVPRHPQVVALADGSLVAAWDEAVSGTRRVVIGRTAAAASTPRRFSREVLAGDGSDQYPVVAVGERGPVIAWASGAPARSVIRVRSEAVR